MERDFDNDKSSRRPRAWRDFKRIFGQGFWIDVLADRLERIARTRYDKPTTYELCYGRCPREILAVALYAFCASTREQRETSMRQFSQWIDSVNGKRPAQPWPEGDVTPVPAATAAVWDQYGWPKGMEPPPPSTAPAAERGDNQHTENSGTSQAPKDGEYIELFGEGRLFEVVTVSGYPRGEGGHECRLVLNLTEQQALFSEYVRPDERADLLARATAKAERRKAA